jgi:serine/threonine protein kinase
MLAVKRLFSSNQADFEKEVEALRVISAHQHSNLIQLLATYRHKQKYHLIFPMAQEDLRSFWSIRENPIPDKDAISWMLQQTRGIADGLSKIHNYNLSSDSKKDFPDALGRYYGRHGDIKPENILCFNQNCDEGQGPSTHARLVIADFGLMELHTASSRSRVDPRSIGGSPTYEAPERSLNMLISQAYDLWSLGCVYMEFMTWLLTGPTGVRQFADARRSFNTRDRTIDDAFFSHLIPGPDGTPRAIVKKAVSRQIAVLRQDDRCSPALQHLLDLMQNKMLVINPRDRASSPELVQLLDDILDTEKRNQEYSAENNYPQAAESQDRRKRPPEDVYSSLHQLNSPSKRIRLESSSNMPIGIDILRGGN